MGSEEILEKGEKEDIKRLERKKMPTGKD